MIYESSDIRQVTRKVTDDWLGKDSSFGSGFVFSSMQEIAVEIKDELETVQSLQRSIYALLPEVNIISNQAVNILDKDILSVISDVNLEIKSAPEKSISNLTDNIVINNEKADRADKNYSHNQINPIISGRFWSEPIELEEFSVDGVHYYSSNLSIPDNLLKRHIVKTDSVTDEFVSIGHEEEVTSNNRKSGDSVSDGAGASVNLNIGAKETVRPLKPDDLNSAKRYHDVAMDIDSQVATEDSQIKYQLNPNVNELGNNEINWRVEGSSNKINYTADNGVKKAGALDTEVKETVRSLKADDLSEAAKGYHSVAIDIENPEAAEGDAIKYQLNSNIKELGNNGIEQWEETERSYLQKPKYSEPVISSVFSLPTEKADIMANIDLPIKLKLLGELHVKYKDQLENITVVQDELETVNGKVLLSLEQLVDKCSQELPYELQEDFSEKILGVLSGLNKISHTQYLQKENLPADNIQAINQVKVQLFEFCTEMLNQINDWQQSNDFKVGSFATLNKNRTSEIDINEKLVFLGEKIFNNSLTNNTTSKINQQLKDLLSGESDLAIMLIGTIAYLVMAKLEVIDLNNSLEKLSNVINQQSQVIDVNMEMFKPFSPGDVSKNYSLDKINAIDIKESSRNDTKFAMIEMIQTNTEQLDEVLLKLSEDKQQSSLDTAGQIRELKSDLPLNSQMDSRSFIQQRFAEFGAKILEANMITQKQISQESKALTASIDEYLSDVDLAYYYIEKLSNISE